jgi:RNA polymerase-binding transcription factor DksA
MGDGTMQDLRRELETLRNEAHNCQLISDQATNAEKKVLFARLAEHHRVLAAEVEQAIESVLLPEPPAS